MGKEYDQIEIREKAFDMALRLNNGINQKIDSTIKNARELEKFLWGGLQPLSNPVTPLSTIEEAANAARKHVSDLIENAATEEKKQLLRNALAQWERFMADIAFALEVRTTAKTEIIEYENRN